MLMFFVNDIHSRPPCLNSNLEETLHGVSEHLIFGCHNTERAYNKGKLSTRADVDVLCHPGLNASHMLDSSEKVESDMYVCTMYNIMSSKKKYLGLIDHHSGLPHSCWLC